MFGRIVQFFQGRHTLFVVACFGVGTTLSWFHRLDSNLVTLLLGLQSMVLVHSTQENYFAAKTNGAQNSNQVGTGSVQAKS
jgi:hypothetical protein